LTKAIRQACPYLNGVSVGDCIKNATAVAERVGEFLGKMESGEQTLKPKT
jgi:hypothetical protein